VGRASQSEQVEIRTLRKEDLGPAFRLDQQAFDTPAEYEKGWHDWVDPARGLGAFAGGQIVALVLMLPLPQFWGGRAVSMEGLSSVAVAPEWRGRGLASQLCREALAAMRGRGVALSALYPGTTALYRSLGWELAGLFQWRRIVPRDWLALEKPAPGALRRARAGDLPAIRACYARWAAARNGFLTRDHPDERTRWFPLEKRFDRHEVLLFGRDEGLDGYLVYRREPARPDAFDHRIRVVDWVSLTREAAEGLAWTLGSAGSQVELITYPCAGSDPIFLLEPEQRSWVHGDIRWMLRTIDVRAAVAERGFPEGFSCEVALSLTDPEIPANAGDFLLCVRDGKGMLEVAMPTRGDAVEMDIGAFSSLYSGWSDTGNLARSGRLHGGAASSRAALDSAFAGPLACLLEEF